MTAHAGRLRFSLDPLIAEAKRRARNRRVLLAAVVLVLALGAGGTTFAVHRFGWLRTSRPFAGPFEPGGMFTFPSCGLGPCPKVWLPAVSPSSTGVAWTVGSVAWRWDQHAWQPVALPRLSDGTLNSVAFLGRSDAWAVGSRSTAKAPYFAVVEHWDGARWNHVRLPHLHESALYGVSAAGPRSVWAVGAIFRRNPGKRYPVARPLLLHWNGASWHQQPLPWAYSALQLSTVVATGPSSVWVVSGHDSLKSRIEHCNGTHWRLVHSPFGSNDPLAGFSATAWNDAWAVGSYRQGSVWAHYSHALVAHWNGYHWRIAPLPSPPGSNSAALVDVAAASPNDAWAIGQSETLNLNSHGGASVTGTPAPYFLHWNGQGWQVTPEPTPWVSQSPP